MSSAVIDYAKYTDMNIKQLVNSLESAKKQKLKFQAQVKSADKLIDFLTAKIKDSLKTPKYDFVPYEKSGLPELAREVRKQFSPQELAQLRQELDDEINRDYGYNPIAQKATPNTMPYKFII